MRGNSFQANSSRSAWQILLAGLGLTAILGWALYGEARYLDQKRFQSRMAEVQSHLDSKLEKSEMLLNNLRDYLMFTDESREEIFARWCYENGLTINCPWLQGIVIATNIHRFPFDLTWAAPPTTWSGEKWSQFNKTAANHPVMCQISLRSRLRVDRLFLDQYPIPSTYTNGSLLVKSIQRSRIAMSEHQEVMKTTQGAPIQGTFFLAPVYHPQVNDYLAHGNIPGRYSIGMRWLHLHSIIVAPMDFGVLAHSVWNGAPADLGIELYSSTNLNTKAWLNPSRGGSPNALNPDFAPYLSERRLWRMYGMKFSIYFHTTPLFESQSPKRLVWIAVAAGTLLTLLSTAFVASAQIARARQEALTQQIQEARDALNAAQSERNQISRDLHDGTIQSLYAIQLGLSHTAEKLKRETAATRREFETARHDLDSVIAEIRRFISFEAPSPATTNLTLVLQSIVDRIPPETPEKQKIQLQCDPASARWLDPHQAVQCANIAREALSNALRHAQASQIIIRLSLHEGRVLLEIQDNGQGFEPGRPRTGAGLGNMEARALEMGAHLELQSSPGQGTRLSVHIPILSSHLPPES